MNDTEAEPILPPLPSIDVAGIDPAMLLAALYNGTRPVGVGFFNDLGGLMTESMAKDFLLRTQPGPDYQFDYVAGRPLKVAIRKGRLYRADMYDRDAPGGPGTCQRIVDLLRKGR